MEKDTLSYIGALRYIEENKDKHNLSSLDVGTTYLDNEHNKLSSVCLVCGRIVESEIEICTIDKIPCFKFWNISTPACMEKKVNIIVKGYYTGTQYYFYLTQENVNAWLECVNSWMKLKNK